MSDISSLPAPIFVPVSDGPASFVVAYPAFDFSFSNRDSTRLAECRFFFFVDL